MKPALRRQIALDMVNQERKRQEEKWGEQNHRPVVWLSILLEEVGETAKSVNEECGQGFPAPVSEPQLVREIVQVAAVAVAWVEAILRLREERRDGLVGEGPTAGTAPQAKA